MTSPQAKHRFADTLPGTFAAFENDVLSIGNGRVVRRFAWHGGNLIGRAIEDVAAGRTWTLIGRDPDIALPGEAPAAEGQMEKRVVARSPLTEPHLQVDVQCTLGTLKVRRRFRVYPDAPAIASELYIKGRSTKKWQTHTRPAGELAAVENSAAARQSQRTAPTLDRIAIDTPHLRHEAIQFFDITDRNNNLVNTRTVLPYVQPIELTGSILFVTDVLKPAGLFVLKEAPCSDVQLAWPGADFICQRGDIRVVGIGFDPHDLSEGEWTRSYGSVVGVAGTGDLTRALREYQHTVRPYQPQRDDTVVLNTWGDRSQDKRLAEAFVVEEIRAAAALGVTHVQLDDGWQSGRSSNSAFEGGSLTGIWARDDYWSVHADKFPQGLRPVLDAAAAGGVEIGLWYNPSKDDDYAAWQRDADQMIALHRDHGVRLIKIDGVDIPSKLAERNVRAMFDKVMLATNGEVSFNLDVTAMHRFGYHFFNEYGNKFLENRYTDWGNYYPHWTLRNLWQLAHYVPPQLLQIEFLNVWRNQKNYNANDPLAPATVGFDYAFAVTMMAQPLAWFEASQLPAEASRLAEMIAAYRQVQPALHAGMILPIGEEPSGTGWTGFQSAGAGGGFVIVYREWNQRATAEFRLHGMTGEVNFTLIAGAGADFTAGSVDDGKVQFALPRPMSFALYRVEMRAAIPRA